MHSTMNSSTEGATAAAFKIANSSIETLQSSVQLNNVSAIMASAPATAVEHFFVAQSVGRVS